MVSYLGEALTHLNLLIRLSLELLQWSMVNDPLRRKLRQNEAQYSVLLNTFGRFS